MSKTDIQIFNETYHTLDTKQLEWIRSEFKRLDKTVKFIRSNDTYGLDESLKETMEKAMKIMEAKMDVLIGILGQGYRSRKKTINSQVIDHMKMTKSERLNNETKNMNT